MLILGGSSFSRQDKEYVTFDFIPKGSQYLNDGCLQSIGTYIAEDGKRKIMSFIWCQFPNWTATLSLPMLNMETTNTLVLCYNDQIVFQLSYVHCHNLLTCVDAHSNLFSIWNLPPSIFECITNHICWLCNWLILGSLAQLSPVIFLHWSLSFNQNLYILLNRSFHPQ